MRCLTFASRNWREIVRDPLTAGFGIVMPLVLLLLMSAIQANIPVALFEIETLSPGVAAFGLTFIALFTAQLISRDRESAFLMRLYASPLTALDFMMGYALPLIPLGLIQAVITFCSPPSVYSSSDA